jgi:hypothetical protein
MRVIRYAAACRSIIDISGYWIARVKPAMTPGYTPTRPLTLPIPLRDQAAAAPLCPGAAPDMLLCWFQVTFAPHRDTVMRRTVWFSLVCMIGLALLVSVRALSQFAGKAIPKTPDSFATEDTPLAVKSDRLVAADDEIVPDKATVKTVKIAFPPSTAKEDPGLVAPRKSYASMRGHAHHHRHYKKRHRHRR